MNQIPFLYTTSTSEQRRFTIERLRERPHSTNELRQMGVYSPPARIKELRNQGNSNQDRRERAKSADSFHS